MSAVFDSSGPFVGIQLVARLLRSLLRTRLPSDQVQHRSRPRTVTIVLFIAMPATEITSLDIGRFTKAALELFRDSSIGSEVQLVERDGKFRLYTTDDQAAARQVIRHIVTAADIEAAEEVLALE